MHDWKSMPVLVILCGSEILSLFICKVHTSIFRIFGSIMEWLGDYLGLTERKHCNLYSSLSKIRVTKQRAMKWVGHERCTVDRNILQSRCGERKTSLDRPRREWEVLLK
jgi:hypothetical protein